MWKGGVSNSMKYQTVIPRELSEALARLSENPDLLKSHDEIVLMDARTEELMSQLASNATADNWSTAADLIDQAFEALQSNDGDAVLSTLTRLRALLKEGTDDADEIWKEIRETIEQRRRVIDTERRIIEAEQVNIRPDRIILLATQISKLVRKYLSKKKYDEFSIEFQKLFYQPEESKIIDLK
jgi:hypothetical protein